MPTRKKAFHFFVGTIAYAVIASITYAAGFNPGFGFLSSSASAEGIPFAEAAPYLPLTLGTCDTAGPIEVEATAGTPGPTAYATMKDAFDSVNAGTHQGTINIEVCGNTIEPAPAGLNASGSGLASYTAIIIKPVGGSARTITGDVPGGPLVDLNGADNVTIDGLNTAGNSLTIANTSAVATSGTSTIRFVGGATNNTITNSNIQGSATMSVATNGAVIFFSTDSVTTNGNDNNTISNNNIGPAGANLPTKGILGNGSTTTTAIGNSGIVITNNNIFDFFGAAVTSAGIVTNGGCNTWTISNNRFYQTAPRIWTTGANHRAIEISNSGSTSGAQGFTITGNTIGYASNSQTGTYTLSGSTGKFAGIVFNGITGGTVSNINNNTVAAVSLTGVTSSGTTTGAPLQGIMVQNGLAITNNNIIGSQSAAGSLNFSSTTTSGTDIYGIQNFSTDNWTATGNNIGGISATNLGASGTFLLFGMRANTSTAASATLTSNTVGGTVANSIQLTATGTASQVVGIQTSNAAAIFTQNIVRNLTSNIGIGTSASGSVVGININNSTPTHTISQNIISNLTNTNTTAASVVTGIQFTGGSGNVIERNSISNLTAATTSTSAEINGIKVNGGGSNTFRNNMINIGAGIANGIPVNGFNEFLGTNNVFHNSIYIGGTPTAGNGNSFAFNGQQTANTRSFRNNIFFNARSNSGAAGKNYIVRVGGTTPNPTGLTVNNNVYFANGTGAVFGLFNAADIADLAAWQSAVGQDANSISANPLFVSTTDLHLTSGSPARDIGASVGVTNDFDNKSRPGANSLFDIGADEFDGIAPVANDMAATAFVVPANGGYVPVNTSGNPQATFTNNGTASQTNVTVRFRVLDPSSTEIYNQTAVIPSIASLASTTVMFPASPVLTQPGFYTMFAKTELGTDTVPANDEITGTFTVAPPLSGIYSVGSGGNYASLTNPGGVFDAINNLGASGNLTINITSNLSGETGAIPLNEIPGGFAVTIMPSGGGRVITGSSTNSIIRINGADNVTIEGSLFAGTATGVGGDASIRNLAIVNTNTAATAGAVVAFMSGTNGAQNDTIRNVSVLGQDPTQTLIGIHVGGNTVGSAGTDNDNVRIENCNIQRAFIGIYNAGASAANQNTGNVVTMNDLSAISSNRLRRAGMLFFNQNGLQVTLNSIGGIVNDESGDAYGIGLGIQAYDTTTTTSGAITNSVVSRNRINGIASVNTTGFSAIGIGVSGGSTGANVISNNMITGVTAPSTSPDIVAGIYVAGATGSSTKLYFNSVSITGDRGAVANQIGSYGLAVTGSDPTLELKDNIFYTTQTSGGGANAKSYAIGMVTTTFANLDSNYNDFVSTGANAGGFRTGGLGTTATDLATLAAWQTAVSDDANSLAVDPLFIDPLSNLHLQGSGTLINAGITSGGITTDFDGQNRDATPDIGADEIPPLVPGSLQFSSATYSVSEAGPTVTLTVTRTGGTDGAVSADYSFSGGTATGGASCSASVDYINTGGTISFANGDGANKMFTVAICNDAAFEGNETFNATLSNTTGGATIGTPNPATVTIVDDDTAQPGSLQLSSATYSVGEAGGSVTITVIRTGGSDGAVSVDYATVVGGTAAGGASCAGSADYVNTSGTVTFGNGVITPQTFTVTVCNDAIFEGSETLITNLSNATGGATIGTPASAVTTIVDDETQPTVQFSSAVYSTVETLNQALPDGGPGSTITVTLSGSSQSNVTVQYATSNGTATGGSSCTPGVDFLNSSGTLTFTGGQTSQTFFVQTCPDTVFEGDETVNLTLSNPSGATLGTPNPAVLTIVENDTQPATVQLSAVNYNQDESQAAVITVSRSGNTSIVSSVDFATAAGSASGNSSCVYGADFIQTLGTVTFNSTETTKTVSIPICGDVLRENTESFTMSLSNPNSNTIIGANSTASISINDAASQYVNGTDIAIEDGAPANPYPSTINVSGAAGPIGSMRVTLYDVTHTNAADMDVLLVGPGGQNILLMGDAGGPAGLASTATITFSDSASAVLPNSGVIATGQYEPTTWIPGQSNFPNPAPAGPYNEPGSTVGGTPSLASVFGGTNPNGDWKLYVRDDNGTFSPLGGINGRIAGGWGIEIFAQNGSQAAILGRSLTAAGQPIHNAIVTIQGGDLPQPRSVPTSSFGYYVFDSLTVGQTYVISVSAKQHTFTPSTLNVPLNTNITNADLIADPSP